MINYLSQQAPFLANSLGSCHLRYCDKSITHKIKSQMVPTSITDAMVSSLLFKRLSFSLCVCYLLLWSFLCDSLGLVLRILNF